MKINFSKKQKEFVLKILKSLACAYVYILVVVVISFTLFSKKIEEVFRTIDLVAFEKAEPKKKELKIDEKTKSLNDIPTYGLDYGKVKIENLDIDLSLYYGSTLEILKNGVGHLTASYSPGEGKTIICTGNNTEGFLKRLPEIKKNNQIIIETTYGTYIYKVTDTKILSKTDKNIKKVQREKEILVLYTGYPVGNIGTTDKVFVTYAELIEE